MNKTLPALAACLTLLTRLVSAQAPAPADRPFEIVKIDPALDELIAPDAKLELLADGFGLTEGPVWVPDGPSGYLLFSDLISNVVYKWTPRGEVSVFLEKAGYSGDDINNAGTQTRRGRMAVLLIGPNGETLDAQGRLVWCASPDGTILRLARAPCSSRAARASSTA